MNTLELEVDLPATRDRVWELWTTAEGLTAWLGVRAEVESRVGGRFSVEFGDLAAPRAAAGALAAGRVLSIDAPRLLLLDFGGTELELVLLPRPPDGCRLRISHPGFGDTAEEMTWFSEAWQSALERLQVLVLREGVR